MGKNSYSSADRPVQTTNVSANCSTLNEARSKLLHQSRMWVEFL